MLQRPKLTLHLFGVSNSKFLVNLFSIEFVCEGKCIHVYVPAHLSQGHWGPKSVNTVSLRHAQQVIPNNYSLQERNLKGRESKTFHQSHQVHGVYQKNHSFLFQRTIQGVRITFSVESDVLRLDGMILYEKNKDMAKYRCFNYNLYSQTNYQQEQLLFLELL